MSSEKVKAQQRANYYRHRDEYLAKARERSNRKRSLETPEEAERRKAYLRSYHAKRSGNADLPEMAARDLALFSLWAYLRVKQRHENWVIYKRNWNRKRYGYKPRKPKVSKPPKAPKPVLSPEEKRASINQRQNERRRKLMADPAWRDQWNMRKRARSKQMLERAKENPESLAALRAKRREAARKWIGRLKQDPEKYRAYVDRESAKERKRRDNNPQRRISCILRNKVYAAIHRQQGGNRSFNTIELTGCTVRELMDRIESQWQPGMNWENFGRGVGKWSLDHRRPCASYDLRDEEQQRQCFHYSNIQPMWFSENCSKNSHWQNRKWSHSDHACQPSPTVQTPRQEHS
jgi:hypothetical protein